MKRRGVDAEQRGVDLVEVGEWLRRDRGRSDDLVDVGLHRATSASASASWPVATPSSSIWRYVSSSVSAAGPSHQPIPSSSSCGPRPLKSPPIRTRSGSYAAIASTLLSNAERSCGSRLRLGRVVGELVDGDELVAGADREHDLGVRRAQRHDALVDADARRLAPDASGRLGRTTDAVSRRLRCVCGIARCVVGAATLRRRGRARRPRRAFAGSNRREWMFMVASKELEDKMGAGRRADRRAVPCLEGDGRVTGQATGLASSVCWETTVAGQRRVLTGLRCVCDSSTS